MPVLQSKSHTLVISVRAYTERALNLSVMASLINPGDNCVIVGFAFLCQPMSSGEEG